jgi:hypothetical protein
VTPAEIAACGVGSRIRTEREALLAIVNNAEFVGSEGFYTILKVKADGRLLDYLEKFEEENGETKT